MLITALALSFALSTAPQDPPTHRQAVNCTGVFLFTAVLTAQAAETEPTAEHRETADLAATLLKAADASRLQAASREGLSIDDSSGALNAWLEANETGGDTILGRELDGCIALYAYAIP
ncbi:MAG: hypothetical protein U1E18_06420 [Brevundimonas sp.]|uniref:hypothetical protein n=1 Tax=Brevundimonas sp. TaxID=1871086 RepID=UPI002AB9E1CD|nr:hypothetical protein [Brevundimonas sp.]MDZ4109221.1 hypothetical protein [Brevundimonas sp.]